MRKMAVRRIMVGIFDRRATFRFVDCSQVCSVKRWKGHAAVIGELFLDAANNIKQRAWSTEAERGSMKIPGCTKSSQKCVHNLTA